MTAAASLRVVVVAAVLLVAAGGGEARAASQAKLTIFAVPATVQFMNHADDRLRGMSTNPFNVAKSLVIVSGGVEKNNGPFPGDDVLYNFRLYSSPTQKKALGSAIFTCYYDFSKHAICNSYFELDRGLIVASGSVAFGSNNFILSITGGTDSYLGALGQVTSRPAAKNSQRFDLQVEGLRG
jgi:hypothetical protein